MTGFARGVDGESILYHGTSLRVFEDSISEEGLIRPYLTNNFEVALLFSRVWNCPSWPPVILEVHVPDTALLEPDRNMYDEPIEALTEKYGVDYDDTLWDAVEDGRVLAPVDWRASLEAVNSVIYDGEIPRENITFVHEVECEAV